MKNKNLSWAAALFVFALLLWCTAATPGKIADPSTYTCAVTDTLCSPRMPGSSVIKNSLLCVCTQISILYVL